MTDIEESTTIKKKITLSDAGNSALHNACKSGDIKLVTTILSTGTDVNITNDAGQTPLMIACYNGDVNLTSTLLKVYRANVHIRDNNGHTALYYTTQ